MPGLIHFLISLAASVTVSGGRFSIAWLIGRYRTGVYSFSVHTVDPSGDLVIASQQDSELVFVKNLGKAAQSVSVLPVTLYGNPWPLDDTRWSPASGSSFMLVSDPPTQLIYRIDPEPAVAGGTATFAPSTAFSSGQGTVLLTNTTAGTMLPIYVGMNNPHGLIFVTE